MEPVFLTLRTAPVRIPSSVVWMGSQAGSSVSRSGHIDAEFNIGVVLEPYRLTFEADDSNSIEIPVYGGDSRFYPMGLPRHRLTLDLYDISPATLVALRQMVRSNRPLALGAWHDESTLFMSRFGGAARDGGAFAGVAEVGSCSSSTILRRSLMDYIPSPIAGDNVMRTAPNDSAGNAQPKIVPGMIGGAISLCAARRNIAPIRTASLGQSVWSRYGATIGGLSERLVHNLLKSAPSESYSIPWNGEFNDGLDITGIVVSASTYYVASVWLRGSGLVLLAAMNSTTNLATTTVTLTGAWTRVQVAFQTAGAQTALRLRLYSTGGLGVSLQSSAVQVEAGRGPTDFIDFGNTPATSDAIAVTESLPMSGWSACWWYKHRSDNDIKSLFSVAPGLGSDTMHFYLYGGTAWLVWGSFSAVWTLPGGVDGAWSQIALVFDGVKSAGSLARFRCYFNGQDLGNRDGNITSFYPSSSASQVLYLGSDEGIPSPAHNALNCPLDRFRLDARVWTAIEVADEYRRFTDPGIRAILERVEGRYFRASFAHSPRAIFTDSWNTQMDLVEVRVNRQAVY